MCGRLDARTPSVPHGARPTAHLPLPNLSRYTFRYLPVFSPKPYRRYIAIFAWPRRRDDRYGAVRPFTPPDTERGSTRSTSKINAIVVTCADLNFRHRLLDLQCTVYGLTIKRAGLREGVRSLIPPADLGSSLSWGHLLALPTISYAKLAVTPEFSETALGGTGTKSYRRFIFEGYRGKRRQQSLTG